MRFLATTNRGLEAIAGKEVNELVGASPTIHHPGVIEFEAPERAAHLLQTHARTLHRVLVEWHRTACETLAAIYETARSLAVTEYIEPQQPIAVRAKRHGEHEFTSPDVEREVGAALIEEYRAQTGDRPPVDLEDPTVLVRVFVRHERVVFAVDATGQHSLHRRAYREYEHDAALRPTVAAAMVRLADPAPGDRLVDPLCGSGTIPIEAALSHRNTPVRPTHEPAASELVFLDDAYEDDPAERPVDIDIVGRDSDEACVAGARKNARAAGVADETAFVAADATTDPIDADIVVSDLPFGIRTASEGLHALYSAFFETLSKTDWKRLVLLTARPDLVPYNPTQEFPVRRGRLEVSLLVVTNGATR
ncbi:THUMP domain-containing class I SAM-dependent RNA methyltransferase [Halovenus marina]|uniref:THUMP domain-containing class I SAM-dependent RNA methyltransferase n=1 Tax=Halovenus marina TaxID=3396621 RepID=UPI003F56385C